MLRRKLLLDHGWLQPQSLHLDVTAFPNSQLLCHATTCHRINLKHECFLQLSSFVTNVFHQQTSRWSRALRPEFWSTDDKARDFLYCWPPSKRMELHAPTINLSLTIVLPRLQPNLRPCINQSVMGCLGTDSSSHFRDVKREPCQTFQEEQCQHIGFRHVHSVQCNML